jgi:hypothetical protein
VPPEAPYPGGSSGRVNGTRGQLTKMTRGFTPCGSSMAATTPRPCFPRVAESVLKLAPRSAPAGSPMGPPTISAGVGPQQIIRDILGRYFWRRARWPRHGAVARQVLVVPSRPPEKSPADAGLVSFEGNANGAICCRYFGLSAAQAPAAGSRRFPDRWSRAYWRPGSAARAPLACSRRPDRWSKAG